MRRIVDKDFEMSFSRRGGTVIKSRVDVWRADKNKWSHVLQLRFDNTLKDNERLAGSLKPGEYTCIFRCAVEESLNGKYDFDLKVDGDSTFADDGDVNITSSNRDLRVFKDQFILEVQ